jgi:hypothetical protein
MTQLLDIEKALLSTTAVAQGLQLTEIKKLLKAEGNAQKQKFAKTLGLAKIALQAHAWFNSEEGKAIFSEAGVTWTAEDFAGKVFGWQKSYFYKVVKAGKLEEAKVERFNELCNEAEAQGHATNRSLEGLLKWAKADAEQAAQADGDGDGEGDGDGAEASVAVTKTILTLSFKGRDMGLEANVALRIDSEGKLTTTATREQIELALALIQSTLNA